MGRLRGHEAIIINSDKERDSLLEYFHSKSIKTQSGLLPIHMTKPNWDYPYNILYRGSITQTKSNDTPLEYIEYSEYMKRRDTFYSFYKHKDYNHIMISDYKGRGSLISNIYLEIRKDIWIQHNINDYEIIPSDVVLKPDGDFIIKRSGHEISNDKIVIGNIQTDRGILLDGVNFYTVDDIDILDDNWIDVDKVLIKQ